MLKFTADDVRAIHSRFSDVELELDPDHTPKRRARVTRRAFMFFYKGERGCADCQEKDPVVLEFDHVDLDDKVFTISQGVHKGWDELFKEMAKCEVRCANCHRRKSYAAKEHLYVRDFVTEAAIRRRALEKSNRAFERRARE